MVKVDGMGSQLKFQSVAGALSACAVGPARTRARVTTPELLVTFSWIASPLLALALLFCTWKCLVPLLVVLMVSSTEVLVSISSISPCSVPPVRGASTVKYCAGCGGGFCAAMSTEVGSGLLAVATKPSGTLWPTTMLGAVSGGVPLGPTTSKATPCALLPTPRPRPGLLSELV